MPKSGQCVGTLAYDRTAIRIAYLHLGTDMAPGAVIMVKPYSGGLVTKLKAHNQLLVVTLLLLKSFLLLIWNSILFPFPPPKSTPKAKQLKRVCAV